MASHSRALRTLTLTLALAQADLEEGAAGGQALLDAAMRKSYGELSQADVDKYKKSKKDAKASGASAPPRSRATLHVKFEFIEFTLTSDLVNNS